MDLKRKLLLTLWYFLGNTLLVANIHRICYYEPSSCIPNISSSYESHSIMIFNHHKYELMWYISDIFIELLLSQDKNDVLMSFHHVLTVFLISGSMWFNVMHIGFQVIRLLAMSNPLLHLSKILGKDLDIYVNIKLRIVLQKIVFLMFTIVFFYNRLFQFPKQVLYNTLFESWQHYNINAYFLTQYILFNCGLLTLQFMQYVWGWKILKILYHKW